MGTEFRDSIQRALNNANLTGALGAFSEAYKVNRIKAYEGIDFEELRDKISRLKEYAASHLDQLCDQFTSNAEARGRLVTTLPNIHIALVGIEKLVSAYSDVATILKALPRSATAQLLTSYVSIISGPTPNDDGSLKELHIILMDNRRSDMANDPKFRQALQCIRCGSCLNVCPIFRLVGGHVFGKVYTGGIGTILTAWFDELKQSKAHSADDPQYVVSACPTCTVALVHEFISTLESIGQVEWISKARELAEKSVDFSSFVKKLVDQGRLSLSEGEELGAITYHDSCHLKRTLKVSEQSRELLCKAGYQLQEMFECDTCCGMGGSYSLKLPEISGPILQRKLKNIRNSGAPVVAMDCPGCVMQIRGGFDQDGGGVVVKHLAELLAERI